MTILELKEYLRNLISCVTFIYDGYSCGIDPLTTDDFDMWCGDESITVHSIDEVMETEFFNGESLDDIWDDVSDLEY